MAFREQDFADTVCTIYSPHIVQRDTALGVNDSVSGQPIPIASIRLRATALRQELGRSRTFYETEALRSGWSVRQLGRQIGSQFYERMALSQNKAAILGESREPLFQDLVTPEEAIKDPFVLEFLDLKDEYSESDFEEALIQHLTDFLLELGDDFAFLGRQRRLRIDDTWFRIDLVFFHRRLRALLIADLKVGKFSYADAGQMHLYLNYAREHWMKPGENPPVGLVLCAEKGATEVTTHSTISPARSSPRSIRLSFQTKISSPKSLNAPAGSWRNARLS